MPKASHKVTIVSHTHWDREWYRPFQEFRMVMVKMIDQLLDILENDNNFRSFLLDGQTILLEDYLEIRPDREADLRRYVGDGRLLVGPWHILPDEFLVGPEATIRNLMLGARVGERFGGRMRIGYTPDPFGHIGQLPQILQGVGITTAVLQRGLAEEPLELRWEGADGSQVLLLYLREGYGNFSWAPTTPSAFVRAIERQIERLAPVAQTPNLLLMNGTDHMLPQSELPDLIATANEQMAGKVHIRHGSLPEYVAEVQDALGDDENLPLVRGELRSPQRWPTLPGVYSARMWIKQRNHACETALLRYAEPLNAFAAVLGYPNRTSEIWRSWRYLMENHPHDSICGCSVDQVHREMRTRFDWSEQIAEVIAEESLRQLLALVNVPKVPTAHQVNKVAPPKYQSVSDPYDNLAIITYNPLPGLQTGRIELDIPWPGPGHTVKLLDEVGRSLPLHWHDIHANIAEDLEITSDQLLELIDQIEVGFYQGRLIRDVRVWIDGTEGRLELVLPEYHTGEIGNFDDLVSALRSDPALNATEHWHLTTYLAGMRRVSFLAQDVSGVGYLVYRLQSVPGQAETATTFITREVEIENEWFHARADKNDGTLTITDKVTGSIYSGLNQLEDGGDRGDEYNYCAPENDRLVNSPATAPLIERIDDDFLGQRLRIQLTYRVPARLSDHRSSRTPEIVDVPVITTVSLTSGVRRVDIRTELVNNAEDHRLRVLFPMSVPSNHVLVDAHFDHIVRPIDSSGTDTTGWAEQPVSTALQRTFVAVQDNQCGLMVATRGLPEYEARHETDGTTTIALTLLRCVGWLSREDLDCRPGHAGPGLPTPEAQCIGPAVFEYSVLPFGMDVNRAIMDAEAFAAPLRAVAGSGKDDMLPPQHVLVDIDSDDLVLSAIKAADDGDGIIVRFYNSGEKTLIGRIRFGVSVREVIPVDLLEQPVEEPIKSDEDGIFSTEVPPKRIITWQVR